MHLESWMKRVATQRLTTLRSKVMILLKFMLVTLDDDETMLSSSSTVFVTAQAKMRLLFGSHARTKRMIVCLRVCVYAKVRVKIAYDATGCHKKEALVSTWRLRIGRSISHGHIVASNTLHSKTKLTIFNTIDLVDQRLWLVEESR